MSLADIVNVTITRETQAITRAGFGTLLIAGPNVNTSSRLTYYTDSSSIASALVNGSSDPEYASAIDALAQNPRVARIALGHVAGTKIITDDAGTYTAGDVVVSVNGNEITESFDTDKDTTLTNLAASIQALSEISTAAYSSVAHTITITPVSGGVASVENIDLTGITGDMTMDLSASITEDWSDALDAINAEQDDWYGLTITSRTEADVLDVAEWAESNEKIFFTASNDSGIIDDSEATATDIAKQLKDFGYDRTVVNYGRNADTEYPDSAYFGKLGPYDPGTYTAAFKKLASITVDDLNPTESQNVRDKNANTYENIGDVNITREGTVASGEFIDIIIFIDWLKSRITENVYSILVNKLKVPYTNDGIAAIDGSIKQILQIGQNRGGISPTSFDDDGNQIGGYYTETPNLQDIADQDKIDRLLQDVKFTAFLSGAIHKVRIDGIVTV